MIRENQLFVFKVNHINRYKIIYLKYSSSLKKMPQMKIPKISFVIFEIYKYHGTIISISLRVIFYVIYASIVNFLYICLRGIARSASYCAYENIERRCILHRRRASFCCVSNAQDLVNAP